MEKSDTTLISKWIPGLKLFYSYKKEWLSKDVVAGLSVAAIALPIGIAYSALIGLPPETGLYASILPMVAYALFGSSRQLIVGPDAATCILVASSLIPLAASGSERYLTLSIILTLLVGLLSIFSGLMKLGFMANFLSKPILTGYLNGLAISIIAGQFGKLLGIEVVSGEFFVTMFDFFSKLNQTNLYTFVIGAVTFVFLRILKKHFVRVPAPLIAVIIGIIVVSFFGLERKGVVVVGFVPSGFPDFGIPSINFEDLKHLISASLGVMLISFCSGILTDKSFAAKNGYSIEANKEFIAFGVSNIFSGLSHGFVITGADSRTAVNDSTGGKTQLVSVVAAISIIFVILFFTQYMEFLPVTVLSAIIISASIGLFNFDYLKKLFLVSRMEFYLAVITSLSVIAIGVLPAVLIAIGLTFAKLIARSSKPKDSILGKVDGMDSYQSIEDYSNAVTIPGLLIYRFEASILFFNADYFKKRVLEIIPQQKEKVNFILFDADSINLIDITASDTISDLINSLSKDGIDFGIARAKERVITFLDKSEIIQKIGNDRIFDSVAAGVEYYLKSKK